ncbi:putative integral membrane protein (DUF6) [Acinetobacter gerneri DSM 14967 = CIP 107464 = MTCC 9824]|nr:putative integral membrane protein (DUF6) [Acinetobacter gerneri DSM 14967 = CIP 107464 = MTCC 9824]
MTFNNINMQYSLLCAFLWSTTGVLVKSITNIPIPFVLFYRFIVAGLFILVSFYIINSDKNFIKSLSINFKLKLTLSLLMVFYYFCATYSFLYTPVALATLLMSLSPCVAIIYKLVKQEKTSIYEYIGFIFAFTGVFLYIYPTLKFDNSNLTLFLWGCALAFLAAVFKAVNSIIIWNKKTEIETKDFQSINILTFLLASFFSVFLISQSTAHVTYSMHNIICLMLLGIFATALPSILNNIASSKTNPVSNTVIGMLTPLLAGLLAWLILNEPLTLWSFFSLSVSIFGVLLIVLKK